MKKPKFHPSIRSMAPEFALAASVALSAHFILEKGWSGAQVQIPLGGHLLTVILPVSVLLFLVMAARPFLVTKDALYTVGTHHLYLETGRCSFNKKHIEVPYEDIRGVRYEQHLIERLLGVGTIFVWTATSESSAIEMRSIPSPQRVTSLIRERLDEVRIKPFSPFTQIPRTGHTR